MFQGYIIPFLVGYITVFAAKRRVFPTLVCIESQLVGGESGNIIFCQAPFVPVLAKTFSLQVHDIGMALVPCLVGTGIPHWVPGCPEKKRMIVIDR